MTKSLEPIFCNMYSFFYKFILLPFYNLTKGSAFYPLSVFLRRVKRFCMLSVPTTSSQILLQTLPRKQYLCIYSVSPVVLIHLPKFWPLLLCAGVLLSWLINFCFFQIRKGALFSLKHSYRCLCNCSIWNPIG